MNLKSVISELVNRARNGDQNAMALIRRTADSAKQGSKKAENALGMIMSYLREHPIVSHTLPANDAHVSGETSKAVSHLCSCVGMDGPEKRTWYLNPENITLIFSLPSGGSAGLMAGAVILADGPDLTNARIDDLCSLIAGDRERVTFLHGVNVGSKESGSHFGATLPQAGRNVFNVGRAVGTARSIQMVRKGADLHHHNETMAWEMG
jgi:hypothetical protein